MRWSSMMITALLGTAVYVSSVAGCGGGGGNSLFNGGDGGFGSSNGGSGGSSSSGGLVGGGDGGGSSGSGGGDGGRRVPRGAAVQRVLPGRRDDVHQRHGLRPGRQDPPLQRRGVRPGGPARSRCPRACPRAPTRATAARSSRAARAWRRRPRVDGSFKLNDAPVGTTVPLVLQVGKWRQAVTVTRQAPCADNAAAARRRSSCRARVAAGDTERQHAGHRRLDRQRRHARVPDAAHRPADERVRRRRRAARITSTSSRAARPAVAAAAAASVGRRSPAWPAPRRATRTSGTRRPHMMPYDIVLLSCEGGETYNANPAASRPTSTPADARSARTSTTPGSPVPSSSGAAATRRPPTGAPTSRPGPRAAAARAPGQRQDRPDPQRLDACRSPRAWRSTSGSGLNKARSASAAAPRRDELPIVQPRFNAVVGPGQQALAAVDQRRHAGPNTMYFSFDTPVNAPVHRRRAPATAVAPSSATCTSAARVDRQPAAAGRMQREDLSPQEKALEFMLFDLSSCVIPDSLPPPADGGIPILQ